MNLAQFLLNDVYFRKGNDDEYEFNEKNEFVKKDINAIIKHITTALEMTFTKKVSRYPFLGELKMHVDHISLKQVLSKYSRDVFGQRRLRAFLKDNPNQQYIFDSMEKFGLKITSFEPYIHRQVGCFFYWLCMLKPFHLEITSDITVPEEDRYIVSFFNEICAYLLIMMMLRACKLTKCDKADCPYKANNAKTGCGGYLTINLVKDKHLFLDFLYAGHYRKISRSSLDLFLSKYCIVPYSPLGECPLVDINARDLHPMFIISQEEKKS